jgi:aspartate racemase
MEKCFMAKIGMIGGTGPESTVDYYKRLINLYQQKTNEESYPEIVITSIDMTAMLKLVEEKSWDALVKMLSDEAAALSRAGATFAFLAANTPHIVFERVQKQSPIPLVSIVEATRRRAESLGLKKLGLTGTYFTMQSRYYQDEFDKSKISLVLPTQEEQQYIRDKLMGEIEKGVLLDSTRDGLLKIAKRMVIEDSIQGLILGCTELPLILTKDEYGIPFLNTTEIHVESIMDKYLNSK